MDAARTASSDAIVGRLVPRLYDAAVGAEPWMPVLVDMLAAVGASALGISFIAYDLWAGHPPLSIGIEPSYLRTYPRYHAGDSAWSSALRTRPVGAVHDVLTWPALERTLVYQEWLRPQSFRHILHVLLWGDVPRRAGMLIGRTNTERPFRERDARLLQRLVPHLQRAIELQRQLGHARGVATAGLQVLDALPVGIVLVDRHARVVFANREAEAIVASGDALVLDDGRLRIRDRAAAGVFASLVRSAVEVVRSGVDPAAPTPGGGVLRAHGSDRTRGLHLLVTPVARATLDTWDGRAVAAVFMTDPRAVRPIDEQWLCELFGLTPAQAALAARLVAGRSLDDIAAELGLAVATIRDRVKQIFARTGTTRQADLVRTLLTSPVGFAAVGDRDRR